jgi:hypothetical protein
MNKATGMAKKPVQLGKFFHFLVDSCARSLVCNALRSALGKGGFDCHVVDKVSICFGKVRFDCHLVDKVSICFGKVRFDCHLVDKVSICFGSPL